MRRGVGTGGRVPTRGMAEVELVEQDAPAGAVHRAAGADRPGDDRAADAHHCAEDGPSTRAVASPAGRLWRRWWPMPVALALAAGVVQYGVDLHERRIEAQYATVPGFVDPLDAPVRTRWTGDGVTMQAIYRGVRAGTDLVGPARSSDGAVDVVAIDLGTGAVRWRANVLGPDVRRSDETPSAYLVTCAPVPGREAAPTSVACVASEQTDAAGSIDGSAVAGPSTTSRLFVLDLATGRALRALDVDAAESVAVLSATTATPGAAGRADGADGGAVVLARGLDGGGVRVWAVDLVTGGQRWTSTVVDPGPSRERTGPAQVWSVAGQLVVEDGAGVAMRLAGDGALVETIGQALALTVAADGSRLWLTTQPAAAVPGDSGLVIFDDRAVPAGVRATVLGPDGVTTTEGNVVATPADDGSVPGLVLADTGRLVAVDAATGRTRWTAGTETGGVLSGGVVLRGVVYVATGSRVVAVDGTTGRTLWRYDLGGDAGATGLVTDGRHVVAAVVELGDAAGPLRLVALEPGDGHVAWTSPEPDVTYVWSSGHALLGWGSGVRRLG